MSYWTAWWQCCWILLCRGHCEQCTGTFPRRPQPFPHWCQWPEFLNQASSGLWSLSLHQSRFHFLSRKSCSEQEQCILLSKQERNLCIIKWFLWLLSLFQVCFSRAWSLRQQWLWRFIFPLCFRLYCPLKQSSNLTEENRNTGCKSFIKCLERLYHLGWGFPLASQWIMMFSRGSKM